MKTKLFLVTAFLLAVAGCKKEENEVKDTATGNVITYKTQQVTLPETILSEDNVKNHLIDFLSREHDFHWEWASPHALWSAIHYGDQSVAIGYKLSGMGDISSTIHEIQLGEERWRKVHDELIEIILRKASESRGRSVRWEELLIEDDPQLPILTIKCTDRLVIQELMNIENVRYIEPLDFKLADEEDRSSNGCSPSTYGLNASDYTLTSPNCYVPWNFNLHNIPTAWNISQGQGITVAVLDAGISSNQSLLNSQFNNGDSNVGRTRTVGYTLGTTGFTSCSHGTSMSGLAVGPRNNQFAATGVAYESNLFFVRCCNDVVLDGSSERTATKNALVAMGNTASVRVISMSIGSPFGSSVLLDGLNYAHNMGKLVMAAAGTSFSWTSWWGVVYPAAYANAVAVTGVNESSNTCSDCHDGSEVDFTIIMERNSDDNRNSISLPMSGTSLNYIGGSSAATATAAGIASLVWSVKPSLTNSQVRTILTQTSQFFPSSTSNRGFGNINASAAVSLAQTY